MRLIAADYAAALSHTAGAQTGGLQQCWSRAPASIASGMPGQAVPGQLRTLAALTRRWPMHTTKVLQFG